MELAIIVMDCNGKAFIDDLATGQGYYMNNRNGELRPAEKTDYFPMNRQGPLLDVSPYGDKRFSTLEEAHEFVCRTSLTHSLDTARQAEQPAVVEALEEALKKYE